MASEDRQERWSEVTKSETQIRYVTFVFLLIVLVVGYLLGEFRVDVDTCIVAYSTGVLLSFVCWVLYVKWWIQTGRSSIVYAWLTWLFLFICVHMSLALYARILFLTEPRDAYNLFINVWMWRWRMFPMSIMLAYMLALVIGRMLGKVDKSIFIVVIKDGDIVDLDGLRFSKQELLNRIGISVIVED